MNRAALFSAILTTAAALPVAAQAPSPTPEATLDRAVAAWSTIRSSRGTFEQLVSNSLTGSSATARGDFQQRKPGQLSIRFTEPAGDRIVSDGRVVWIYLPSSTPGQVMKRSAAGVNALPMDLTAQFLEEPRQKYEVSGGTPATVDGRSTRSLLLVPKQGRQAPFTRATVWVDDDDAFIRQFEVVESTGITRRVKITSLQTNVPVDRDAFSFSPPKGVKVVEEAR
jgi:outer membrane lipoprotein carrier protein